jgi:hypothetical protein
MLPTDGLNGSLSSLRALWAHAAFSVEIVHSDCRLIRSEAGPASDLPFREPEPSRSENAPRLTQLLLPLFLCILLPQHDFVQSQGPSLSRMTPLVPTGGLSRRREAGAAPGGMSGGQFVRILISLRAP